MPAASWSAGCCAAMRAPGEIVETVETRTASVRAKASFLMSSSLRWTVGHRFGGGLYRSDGGIFGELFELQNRNARDDRAVLAGCRNHDASQVADLFFHRRRDFGADVDERAAGIVDLHVGRPRRHALALRLAAPPIDLEQQLRVDLALGRSTGFFFRGSTGLEVRSACAFGAGGGGREEGGDNNGTDPHGGGGMLHPFRAAPALKFCQSRLASGGFGYRFVIRSTFT